MKKGSILQVICQILWVLLIFCGIFGDCATIYATGEFENYFITPTDVFIWEFEDINILQEEYYIKFTIARRATNGDVEGIRQIYYPFNDTLVEDNISETSLFDPNFDLSMICGIINIVLNLILIPEYFALGSAIASLITQSFVAILQVLLARKIFQFSINFKRIAAFVFFIGGVLLFAMFSVDLEFKWIYKFIAILVFTLILAFILRLIHLKVLVDLLKNGDEQ